VLVSGCAGVAGGPFAPGSAVTSQRTVKILLLESFSGDGAAAGRRAENSLRVQADRLNTRGGLLGRHVEVVAADDESSPTKVGELAREQLTDGQVRLVVGPGSSATFDAVKPVLRQARVPNCVTAVADATMADSPVSFRAAPSDRDRLGSLLAYLRRSHPEVRSVGLIDSGEQPARLSDDIVAAQAGSSGLAYAGTASSGTSDGDAVSAVQVLAAQGAQAALVSGSPGLAARVAAAVAAAGLQGRLQLLGLEGFGDYSFPSTAGEAAAGSVFAGGIQTYLTQQAEASWPAGYRDFFERGSRAYGLATNGVEIQGSPAIADCVLQWSRAVQKSGTFTGTAVTSSWEQLDLAATETALGVRERASPDNHTTVSAEAVFVYSWIKSGTGYRLRQLAGPAAA
jgi:branched-chain amino acid transport system substrate-binding protein